MFGRRPKNAPPPARSAAGGSLAPAPERERRLADHCAETFSLVLSFRERGGFGEPGDLRRRLHEQLARIEAAGREAGVAPQDLEDVRFALVALADETVLNQSGWPGRAEWLSKPLQLELFQVNVAGEEFFTRLDALRRRPDAHDQALEVYYLCLVLGFEGRMRLSGRERVEALIAELAREMATARKAEAGRLSPRGGRPDEVIDAVGEGVPVWVTGAIFVPAVFLEIVFFALIARAGADKAARVLAALGESLGPR